MSSPRLCKLCDEPLTGKRVFCDKTCRRVWTSRQTGSERGHLGTCYCGKNFIKKGKNHKFCSEQCGLEARGEAKKPSTIRPCELCGTQMTLASPNVRFCRERCIPSTNLGIPCNSCGEEKSYDEFYDYRDGDEGKLNTTCKVCWIKRRKPYVPTMKTERTCVCGTKFMAKGRKKYCDSRKCYDERQMIKYYKDKERT